MALFHDLLVTKIVGHLGEYQGVHVTMGPARAGVDTEIVITQVDRPRAPANQVDWVVSVPPAAPRSSTCSRRAPVCALPRAVTSLPIWRAINTASKSSSRGCANSQTAPRRQIDLGQSGELRGA